MSKFARFNIFYISIVTLLWIYGTFFTAFEPAELLKSYSKIISFISFAYFLPVGVIFYLKNKSKIMWRSNQAMFKSSFRFYIFVYCLYPLVAAIFSFVNYHALSKGFPSIYNGIFCEKRHEIVVVTGKRLWGKRDSYAEVFVSGFALGFPVSRSYYDSVSVGQSVKVSIASSWFGKKINFLPPT